MNIDLAEFANFFDIFCLIIILASALLSLKAGLLKNLLNLAKWIALITVLKYSFGYLRVPFKEALNLSPTLIDITIFISVFIIQTTFWMIKNHPHQNVYFNIIAQNNFNENFEMDYWGTSNKNVLEYIAKNTKIKLMYII